MEQLQQSYKYTLQRLGASRLLQSDIKDVKDLRLAGVIPWRKDKSGLWIYLMRPVARKAHLPPPEFQIGKGTRMIRDEDAWRDLGVEEMPLSDSAVHAAEPLVITALREAEEELGLKVSNLEGIKAVGRERFISASGGEVKEMMLYMVTLQDPDRFNAPDIHLGKSSECRWVSFERERSFVRSDHRDVLVRIFDAMLF